MELESTNSGPTAKLPILKLREYEMWVIRMKQYFQIQDYALWEMSTPATTKEKTNKKNDVKAMGLLLIRADWGDRSVNIATEHSVKHQDAKEVSTEIKTTPGSKRKTMKTRSQRQCCNRWGRSDNGTEFKNKVIRSDNGTEFKNKVMDDFCREKEAVSTACYVQNRVLVVKPYNKTPCEIFRGKFDGKSDEGFFVGYSLSSKAFRVYNTRTRRVKENLHIGFLENKLMIEGNGPKWLFDIDSLTQSMNYVPVAAGTISNESAGTQGELNAGTFTQKEEITQDCIVMPIWKDVSYFDSPSKGFGNGEPNSVADDQKQVEDGPHNESDEKDNPEVNTGRFKLNNVDPSVNTASSYELDSPKDMFKLGASHTLETTHVEFFSDEDELEVDLGNIINSYTVPTTPNKRIHKDHPIKNVIGDIEPTSIAKAPCDSSWVEAMQEELLQFKLQ
ncbi:putative ribonuclease H-like domain-containing protein [Tanacetum coccineum]